MSQPWPLVFHRIWLDEEESPNFAPWKERLAELHPDWEIRTWQDSSELRWLRNQELFDRYLESDPYGRIPDILRYELLWRFGGVYIDCDFEPLRPLDELLTDPRPFAAWENDRTMCTAILAAPPEHPAVDALITGLPARAAEYERRTPNYATGPEWATSVWRGRDDVRRLPPWTFYPVGWWERHLLGDPNNYHPDTFAVHHWAKGWGDDAMKAKREGEGPRVVVLVPWRESESRAEAWDFCKRQYEQFPWEVVLGDVEGPWNRSAAINAAANAAGSWDVAVIVDADTVHQAQLLKQAVAQALADSSVIVPWNLRWKLSREGSLRFMQGDPRRPSHSNRDLDHTDRTPARLPIIHRGGAIVVSRAAWDAIGGFDEAFEGWGHEDVAFRIAAETLSPGGLKELRGTIWHLWHERSKPSESNNDRKELYRQAAGNALELVQLQRESLRREKVSA